MHDTYIYFRIDFVWIPTLNDIAPSPVSSSDCNKFRPRSTYTPLIRWTLTSYNPWNMTSPSFRFKHPLSTQAQSSAASTPSTQLSARNFIVAQQRQPTPASSSASTTLILPGKDDIVDPIDDPISRNKRRRRDSTHDHDISSEEEGDVTSTRSGSDTPIHKRPPVIVPHVSPNTHGVELSPSRKRGFLATGLAKYADRVIRGHRAVSSVSLPYLDYEEKVRILDSKLSDGGVGWMCRVDLSEEMRVILLLKPTSSTLHKEINCGDSIAISNFAKVDDIWICGAWHHYHHTSYEI
jgi:hypothetical protein